MCDPVTLAVTATVAAAASAGVAGYSQAQQQKYQGKVARQNATLEAERANSQRTANEEERRNLQRRYASLRGSQRAAMAANGLDLDFGSAADTLSDTDMIYQEDLKTQVWNSGQRVRGIDISAANFSAEAKAQKMAARGAAVGTALNVGSTILGGVGQVKGIQARQAAGGSGWGAY